MEDPDRVPDGDEPPSSSSDAADVPPADILAPSPLLTLAAFLVGGVAELIWPTQLLPGPWSEVLGGLLVGAGAVLFVGALWVMEVVGKHPSHADEPPRLITGGPYRYSRNPIYTGHSLAHAGGALLVGSVWVLLALVPVVLYLNGVVREEETRLRALFGAEYTRYCQEVRRWL
jgi:protein-S-isoprenylcysteine O-methyltransferase Ste14